jgi:endonuclease/exonuclease/phosphatase family metal-dependent hydrolase
MIGGDFNLSRVHSNKSSGRINLKFAYCFNDWINKWGPIELNPSNRKYTWSNNQENLILAKLDWIFVSTDFEMMFPLSRVLALAKGVSDHNPLVEEISDLKSGGWRGKILKMWLVKLGTLSVIRLTH